MAARKAQSRFTKALTLRVEGRPGAMTADECRETLQDLELSAYAAARLLGVNDRTVRRWIAGDLEVPPTAERFLRYIARTGARPEKVMEVLEA
jgi:DNA-binding transcriptional regulator YiaG